MSNVQTVPTAKATTVVVRGRVSYVNVHEPRAMQNDPNGVKKYSLNILIGKSDAEQIAKIGAAIKAAYELGLSSSNPKQNLQGVNPATMEKPIHDADTDDKKKTDPVYAGHYFIVAKGLNKPGLLDENKNELLDKTKIYSGCYCYVEISFFPFKNMKAGVGAGLNNVMKWKDGEALAGSNDPQSAFAAIPAATGAASFAATAPGAPAGNPFTF